MTCETAGRKFRNATEPDHLRIAYVTFVTCVISALRRLNGARQYCCISQTFWNRATCIATIVLTASSSLHSAERLVSFIQQDGTLAIVINSAEVARYVFQDKEVSHPYFAAVKTIEGQLVTRRHPPVPGQDAVDHVGLHTGIWLSFGDLNGCDYWRLKARTEHIRFISEPAGGPETGSFTVLNRYLATDGKTTVCEETCRYTVQLLPVGYMLEMASEFRPGKSDLIFGDQEEMGLGVRLATSIAVDRKLGGRILDSEGRRNGAEVWGKSAQWCDYSGPVGDRWVGLTVLTGPENFRPCWSHARDYGFLAMNPFGRNAFTKQEASRVIVKPGETFRLRYGVVVHVTATEQGYKPAESYAHFASSKHPDK